MAKPKKPKFTPSLATLVERLHDVRIQMSLLGGLVGIVVLAVVLTDVATGGDAEPPPSLGSDIAVTPGTRVVVIPSPAAIGTPTSEAAPTATPSSEADALARDAERLRELALLRASLAEYRDRFDKYPSTGGQIQTLCRYEKLDKGCDLKKVLDADEVGILEDPLSVDKGYWYASDGETYTIWMLREGPANPGDPVCSQIPPGFSGMSSLFCFTVAGSP